MQKNLDKKYQTGTLVMWRRLFENAVPISPPNSGKDPQKSKKPE